MTNFSRGNIIKVMVTGITEYGIFVRADERFNGLIHISEVSDRYVKDPNRFAKENEIIYAEILDVNKKDAHLKLSIKNLDYREENIKNSKKNLNSIDKYV